MKRAEQRLARGASGRVYRSSFCKSRDEQRMSIENYPSEEGYRRSTEEFVVYSNAAGHV